MNEPQRLRVGSLPFDPAPCAKRPKPEPVAVERARLTGQAADILDRLRSGPASNWELARLALKYTSRISDLRKRGYCIQVISRDRASGVVFYALLRFSAEQTARIAGEST